MPKYTYRCQSCQKSFLRYKRYDNIEVPEFCTFHQTKMDRLFTASFQIIGCREGDKPENQLYNILTKGGGMTDQLAMYKKDRTRMESDLDALPPEQKEFTTQDILNTGIVQAAQSGNEGIANWRKEHIPERAYTEGEAISG
jgi:hypothetical protein